MFRFAYALVGRGKRRTFRVRGSTRTMALRPPSVIHGAPSGPTMTPCGAEPLPEPRESGPPGPWVQPAELARVLRRVPDATVAGRSDIVRMRAARDGELAHAQLALASRGGARDRGEYENGDRDRDAPEHPVTVRDPNVLLTHRSQESRYGAPKPCAAARVVQTPIARRNAREKNPTPRFRALCRSRAGRSGRTCGRADVDRIPRRPELPLGQRSREPDRVLGKPGRIGDAAPGALGPDRAATPRAPVGSVRSGLQLRRPRRRDSHRAGAGHGGAPLARRDATLGERREVAERHAATPRRLHGVRAGDRFTLLRPLRGVPLRPVLVDLERAEPAGLPHTTVRRSRPFGRAAELLPALRGGLPGDQGREPARARRDRRDVCARNRQPLGRSPGALSGALPRGGGESQPAPEVRRLGAPSVPVQAQPEAFAEGPVAERHARLAAGAREEPLAPLQAQERPDLGHRVRARDEAAGCLRRAVLEAGRLPARGDRDRAHVPVRVDVHLVRVPGRSGPALGVGALHADGRQQGIRTVEVLVGGAAARCPQCRAGVPAGHGVSGRDAPHAAVLRRRREWARRSASPGA